MVDLVSFSSLFEIGFALHIAVTIIERIYARELPVRVDRIARRLNALERFKREMVEIRDRGEKSRQPFQLHFAYRTIDDPVWSDHNDALLAQLAGLAHLATGRLGSLRRALSVVTALSICVIFYTITMLFLIALDISWVNDLHPLTASCLVLTQLLPLPIAAGAFLFVARRMSLQIDRKLRGMSERGVLLSSSTSPESPFSASIEEIYQRDLSQRGRLYSRPWQSPEQ